MAKNTVQTALFAATGLVLAGLVSSARATIAVDGTLDSGYGSALSVQTINTGFGDSTAGDGSSNGGSELDAAYASISNGTLYLFLSGNFEANGNHVNVFISDGRAGGQNVLNATTSSGSLSNANGLTFPTGFNATYAIDANRSGNQMYFDQYSLTSGTGQYLGNINLTGGIGNSQNLNGIAVGLNDTNAAGVNGNGGTAADPTAAAAVGTGLEFAIPLAALGNPTGSIQVLADINNGGNNYLSNQFLGGLPVGYGNLASPSSTNLNGASAPVVITLPAVANGTWLPTGGGSWITAANWSNSVIPNSAGASATFASATGNSLVTLDAAITAGTITFNSTSAYTISAGTGGKLTMNNNGSQASITSYGGSQTISAPIVLVSNTTVTAVSHGDIITLSGNINGSGGLTTFSQGAGGTQFAPSLVVLSGSNSYTGGTTIDGGNLVLGSANALPVGTALTLDAHDVPAGVLDLNGFSATVSSLTEITGPNTQALGAVGQIINTNSSAGVSTLKYAGTVGNPSVFAGTISDSGATSGAVTSLVVTSGSLTLTNTNTYAGATNVSGGSLTLGAAGALPSGTNLTVAAGASVVASNLGTPAAVVVGSLSVAGKLDLNNNVLVVHSSPIGTVQSLVQSGYNQGKWNGASGILSTTASTDTTHLTAIGVIQNSVDGTPTGTALYGTGTALGTFEGTSPINSDVLVKYTYYGDTNLDGKVDGSDYSRIDAAFGTSATGWYNGDFNYDGKINGSDYTLLDNAYNSQGAQIASAIASPTAQVASQIAGGSAGGSSVPEPTSMALLAMGATGLLGRRRRAR